MTDRSRRARDPEHEDGFDSALMVDMAKTVGNVAGTMAQMNERLGELAQGQRDTSKLLERSVRDNAEQHQDMAERLTGVEATMQGVNQWQRTTDQRLEALERRKPAGKGGLKSWADAVALAKQWVPIILAALVGLWAYITGTDVKGGPAP